MTKNNNLSHTEAVATIARASLEHQPSLPDSIAMYLRLTGVLKDGAEVLAAPVPDGWVPGADAQHPSLATTNIINFLARCGLVFIKGEPPANEDNVILLWTGGCNAIAAFRKNGEWLQFPSSQPLDEEERIHCWMRMPHPSIWPEVKLPANMFSEPDLYRMAEGAIALAAAQAAWTLQAGTHAANAVTDITILLGKMQSIVDETPAFSSVGPMAKENLADLGDLIEVARKRLVDIQLREDR
ncbi:hypothetical protein GAY28_10135 [Azospirillum brasilense]|nr:hypothetical protein [Azospirillum brasilense]